MQNLFPPELLEKSVDDRFQYFSARTVIHPQFQQTYRELRRAIGSSTAGSLVNLYGATGIGKTTLLNYLKAKLFEEFAARGAAAAAPARPQETIPVVLVEAPATDRRSFDWKDFYRRYLVQLRDPMPDKKNNLQKWTELQPGTDNLLKNEKAPVASFRAAVENALAHRRPEVVLLDEAIHLRAVSAGSKTIDQLNVVKSIANTTGVTHVLAGTYALLDLMHLSDQVARRSVDVHFQRYDAGKTDDQKKFQNVIVVLQNHLPVRETADLAAQWEYLYERTFGCVGILKQWFNRSLYAALQTGDKFNLKHLHETAPNAAQCKIIWSEIYTGESVLSARQSDLAELRVQMGLDRGGFAENTVGKVKAAARTTLPAAKKLLPGVRKPKRDPLPEQP